MKFLEEEFDEVLVDNLREKYEESILEEFELNRDNVLKVIDYLKDIGIEEVDELIRYRIELFTQDIDNVIKAFNTDNMGDLVESINEDITNIDKI